MSEEIKAPVIEGFERCSRDEFAPLKKENSAMIQIDSYYFYYKRIKPKEKSIREIVQKEWGNDSSVTIAIANILERILENYVKKEE